MIEPADSALSRAAFAGSYTTVRAELRVNPSAGLQSLDRGWHLRAAYERASGDFRWDRYELATSLHRRLGRWTVSGRADAGLVRSAAVPPQALYQVRRVADFIEKGDPLPFTGDRGSVARAAVMYTLPFLNAPFRVFGGSIAGPAPSPYAGIQYGYTDASAATQVLLDRFGWQTSGRVRTAAEFGIRLFGGSIGVGAVRPIDTGGEWRFGLRGGLGL
jgi:hypothetical protein